MSNRTVTQLGAISTMAPLMVPLSAQNQMVKGNTYADTVEVGVRTLTLIGAGLRERGWLDLVRDKPWPSGRGGIARTAQPSFGLAVQRGVCCCSMYWRTMEIGAPPQDEAK